MEADMKSKLESREKNNVHVPPGEIERSSSDHYCKRSKKIQLVGILNCTPDSYYDGGLFFDREKAIAHGHQLVADGADIIDIGGESTRPGFTPVSEEEELRRTLPVIEQLKQVAPLSIDSSKPAVVEAAILAGISMINDVHGFSDAKMRRLAAESGLPICVMHQEGSGQTRGVSRYPKGVISEIYDWFQKRIDLLLEEGVSPKQIILDPGIGFGKNVDDNLTIIGNLEKFKALGFPLYIGLSRKAFLQKILDKSAKETLSTTLALSTISVCKGVSYMRVHDVKEHHEILILLERFNA